jgi:hypothetical protein
VLENPDDRQGCRASLRLPLQALTELRADNLAQERHLMIGGR